MADKVKQYALKATRFIPVVIIFTAASLCLIIIGCINIYTDEPVEYEKVIDYTDCKNLDNKTCSTVISPSNYKCECIVYVNLTEALKGNVSFHYELETFDQSESDYKSSRDDQQLMGILSETPSDACEPYRYAPDKRPIAPCGKVADSFFLDTYSIRNNDTHSIIRFVPGVLSEEDKKGFKNPTNMSLLGSTFASPINWPEDIQIQELQIRNPNNNAFQNERFIGWMKTDLKRKPLGRLNQIHPSFENGLEQGQYRVKVNYRYSNYYNGSRKLIFYSKDNVQVKHTASKIGLSIGCVMLVLTLVVAGLIMWFYPSIVNSSKSDSEPKTNNSSVEPSSPELNPLKPPNTNEE